MNTAKYGVGADFGFRPATEQEQAEAYVRQQRPHLMELTFGCEVACTYKPNKRAYENF
jgi:hypothetical protein